MDLNEIQDIDPIMIRLYHISKRLKGTGIYGFRGGLNASFYKLEQQVSDEVKRRQKRDERRRNKKPLSVHFRDGEEKHFFDKMILKNINDLRKTSTLSDILTENNVTFTDVKSTSTLKEVVIFWKMTNSKNNPVKLAETEQKLISSASVICEELNQTCSTVAGKIPKIVFEQDYKMKSDNFINFLQNFKVEDNETTENCDNEFEKNCEINEEISTSTPPVQLKTNVLQFKRDKVLDQVNITAI